MRGITYLGVRQEVPKYITQCFREFRSDGSKNVGHRGVEISYETGPCLRQSRER